MRTVGVEEELLLVDPTTRRAVPRADEVLARRRELDRELFRHQVEVQTEPALDLADLATQVRAQRRVAGEAAAEAGLAVVASGTSPLAVDLVTTDDERYRAMVEEYGDVARGAGTCGVHVHVAVESDEEAVRVVDGLQPWLPLVLALSANSPFDAGHDTGHASWRTVSWGRWPTAGPTQPFGSVTAYEETCAQLLEQGAARDRGMLYFDARPAVEHPTVEVRVADVPTDPDDTVLLAALVRALVETTARSGPGAPVPRPEPARAARWRAARYGVTAGLVDPRTTRLVPAAEALDGLLDHLAEVLLESGDADLARDGVRRVLGHDGASAQRAAWRRTGSVEGVVDDLVERTTASWR